MSIPSTLLFSCDPVYDRLKTQNTKELIIRTNPPGIEGNFLVKVLEIHLIGTKILVWTRLNQVMSKSMARDRGFTEVTVNVPNVPSKYTILSFSGLSEKEFRKVLQSEKEALGSAAI